MSYHIIHILTHSSKLSVDRGCLVCTLPDKTEKRLPKDGILAVVVAARGVLFTSDCLSRLLENNVVVLHCDGKYQPIGKTMRLNDTVHGSIFETQIKRSKTFNDSLWDTVLRAKINNQAVLLDKINVNHNLWEYLKQNRIDESNTARQYWSLYFPKFSDSPELRERRWAKHPVNQMLNYSYAVISAILHRSMVAHGLNTQLGIHHKFRFKTDPLLYDLMEPLRPICDYLLLDFHSKNSDKEIQEWVKFVGKAIVETKFQVEKKKFIKMVYVIDRYVNGIANCFYTDWVKNVYYPNLTDLEIEK